MKRRHCLLTGLPVLLAMSLTSAFGESRPSHGNGNRSTTAPTAVNESPQSVDDGSSDALWARAQKMFAVNDFAQASAAAEHVTSPALKREAQAMVSQIRAYVAALQDGVAAENRHDPAAAIQSYTAASRIKSDGPGDPLGRIARVKSQAASAAAQAAAQATQAQRALGLTQAKARAAQLAKKGASQQQEGDLKAALASFEAAQAVLPGSPGVSEAIKVLRGRLDSPGVSAAAEPELTPALRDFYAGQYDKAAQELNGLASTPKGKLLGAVYFYLGAARFEHALLETGSSSAEAARQPEVQAAFRQARSLGYVPLPRFVSPVLLTAWQTTL